MTPRKETPIVTRQAVINMRENGMRGTEIDMESKQKKKTRKIKKKQLENDVDSDSNNNTEKGARYRTFQESTIDIHVEMNKQNIGEFTWDHNCTRIDALVAPMLELDRTTTPEVPISVDLY